MLSAAVVDRFEFNLYAQKVGNETVMNELKPVSVIKDRRDWFVNFSKCIYCWSKLTIVSTSSGGNIYVYYYQRDNNKNDAGRDR